jgi:hypothetical protein
MCLRRAPEKYISGAKAPAGAALDRAGLDDMEKLKFLTLEGLELRPLCCPARSQSLYRLRCRGSSDNLLLLYFLLKIKLRGGIE